MAYLLYIWPLSKMKLCKNILCNRSLWYLSRHRWDFSSWQKLLGG